MDSAAREMRFEDAIALRTELAELESKKLDADKRRALVDLALSGRSEPPLGDILAELGPESQTRALKRGGLLARATADADLETLAGRAPREAHSKRKAVERSAALSLKVDQTKLAAAWRRTVDRALALVVEALPSLTEIATVASELRDQGDTDPWDDRNRQKKIADHVAALRSAVQVAAWVVEAETEAGLPDGPKDAAAIAKVRVDLEAVASALDLDQTKGVQTDDDRPSLDATLPSAAVCALTLRPVADAPALHYDLHTFLAPACNFWVNLVSSTSVPEKYDDGVADETSARDSPL